MIKKTSSALAAAMIVGLACLSGTGSLSARNYEYNQGATGGEMLADAVIVRPLTLAASAVGLAAWVVTLPFSIPAGNAGESGKAWVGDPLKYTFMRPIGNMDVDAEPAYVQDGR